MIFHPIIFNRVPYYYRIITYIFFANNKKSSSHCFTFHFLILSPHPQNRIPYSILLKLSQEPSLPFGQASGLLVPVSSTPLSASTPSLSTSYSPRGLQLTLRMSHLEDGFTLRCLQRLSAPGLATLPWNWFPTGTPAARPSRSSRTRDRSSQISCARAG